MEMLSNRIRANDLWIRMNSYSDGTFGIAKRFPDDLYYIMKPWLERNKRFPREGEVVSTQGEFANYKVKYKNLRVTKAEIRGDGSAIIYVDGEVAANAARSTNSVVAKALNAVVRNIRAIPVDSKGKGIIERCEIRTADGEVGEVAYIDEDGYVYFEAKDGRIRGVPAKTVVRLNAATSTVTETAVNTRWRIIYKNLNGPLFPYGKETYSTKEEAEKRVEELRKQSKKWGSNNSYFVDVVNTSVNSASNTATEKAVNAKFKAGDKAYVHWFSGEDELVDVISYEPKGDYYIVRGEDGQLAHPKASLLYPVKNSCARNAAGDAATRKFKPNDVVEWNDYKGRHNSAYYFRDNGPDRVTVSIYRDGQGGFLEVPRAWITNSRVRNAAGYVDASSVVLHPGDAVVFKAQYSSHKDDDEWLERNGDTVREVRGNEVKLGPSANDWAKKSDLMVWHNAARACNSNNAVVRKALNATAMNYSTKEYELEHRISSAIGTDVNVKIDDDRIKVVGPFKSDAPKVVSVVKSFFRNVGIVSRSFKDDPSNPVLTIRMDEPVENSVVAKALNAAALNYSPYAKGAWIHDDKGKNYTVVEEEHWGKDGKAVRLVTIRDEATKQTKEIPVTELSYRFHMGEAESCRKCGNAALNFSPGDKVSIVDTDIRYGGDKGEVVRKDGFRYVVRLTSRQDKPEVTLQPNQLKAANSEDAQGHEHGSDGKFASKDGGSDGGDSYEDPKTKRMKERLAKMREKNEALRKEIDQRKAALTGKKEEIEKMRADVMKANVEKWKAGLSKTTNSVVAKALNAVANASDDAILRRCNQANIVIKGKMGNVHSIVYGSGWIYPLVSPNRVLLKVFGSVKEAEKSALVNAVATNAVTDWEHSYTIKGLPVKLAYRGSPYNDIKATVEGGNRDWIEVARVSMSNPPSQAEAEKMVAPKWSRIKKTATNAVANAGKAMISRVGSDWYYSWADGTKDGREGPFRSEEEARVSAKQDGFAVINAVVSNALKARSDKRIDDRVVMPNSTALNWNYKNSYQFFCVDPSMKAPCILSGWDYREDAKEDAAELKELHIPFKIVSRRYLEQQGIDPNAEASWKKNRR